MTNRNITNNKQLDEGWQKACLNPSPEMRVFIETVEAANQRLTHFKKEHGRYTLNEAAKFICKRVGKTYADIISELVNAVDANILDIYLTGSYARTKKLKLSNEVHWDDLNAWLKTSYPRSIIRFDEPKISRQERVNEELIFNSSCSQGDLSDSIEEDIEHEVMRESNLQEKAEKELFDEAILALEKGERDALLKITSLTRSNHLSKEFLEMIVSAVIKNANTRRGKTGGDKKAAKLKEPKEQILQVWASGKYESRAICAEEEYSNLGFMSYKTARKTLTNSPDPSPWPAKKKIHK